MDPQERLDPADSLPLAVGDFHVLLALLDGPRHGHAVKVDLALRTGGEVVMGAGTLYPALGRMLRGGLIEEVGPPDPRDHDERRRYYDLTAFGRRVAQAEARRLVRMLAIAAEKNLLAPAEFRIER